MNFTFHHNFINKKTYGSYKKNDNDTRDNIVTVLTLCCYEFDG